MFSVCLLYFFLSFAQVGQRSCIFASLGFCLYSYKILCGILGNSDQMRQVSLERNWNQNEHFNDNFCACVNN